MKKSINRNRILETIWLIVAVLSVLAGVHKTYIDGGFRDSYLFFIIAVISFLMFFLRRNLRRKKKQNPKPESK